MVYDVVVIGGGIAGMTAARRAQQLGATVIVVNRAQPRSESASDPGSNTRISGGLYHTAYHNPYKHGPQELYDDLMRKTDRLARPDVARAWADNALRALEFLIAEGAEVKPYLPYSYTEMGDNAIQPPMKLFYPLEWQGRGPDVLLTKMEQTFEQNGGVFRFGTRAIWLAMVDGAARGVIVEGPDREVVSGRSVVMADGGFHANRELIAEHISTYYNIIGTSFDNGDCLRMALEVGARAVNLGSFYGHVCIRDDGAPRERWLRHPSVGAVANAAMVVGGDGRRVGDETFGQHEGVESIADALVRSKTPGGCWVIFDDDVWRGVGTTSFNPLNPGVSGNERLHRSAGSVAELARVTGLPPDALVQSVEAFNRFCTDGTPLDPPRTERVSPIARPPIHAAPIMTQITFTMGGVLVNGRASVLDGSDQPIPGLYAAGGTIGGLQGGPRNGYSGGWSQAATFGLIAGESAAAYVGSLASTAGTRGT